MREIRQSGSEGGATSTIVPTPILGPSSRPDYPSPTWRARLAIFDMSG